MIEQLIKHSTNKEYLGDGVFIAITQYKEVLIWTKRDFDTHWMVLGSSEVNSLKAYLKELE